ncbi:MAG TPA: nucleotidyltransferase domain-containing protein [Patescibacteria group bacterium]|nr:nucleotidyltransferase domain-containing protein [Patescibacteria group bacterium]
MSSEPMVRWPVLRTMVDGLAGALGGRLRSVVLYGSAARDDFHEGASDLNLVVVTDLLDPATLEALSGPVHAWVRKRQPPPRLMTPEIVADAADVYAIEFLDLRSHRVVLHGEDPFGAVVVRPDLLRVQCERELREKLMRLREAYLETHASRSRLRRLLIESYSTFTALFRGCLHLMGQTPPARNADVAAAFCARAGIDGAPFSAIAAMRQGGAQPDVDLKTLFARYYEQLGRAVGVLDAFRPDGGGGTR